MALYGVSFVATVIAWDTVNNTSKTGDAANISLFWTKDGTPSSTTNACSEVSSSNQPGQYKVTLTSTEAQCLCGTVGGKSSSSGIVIIPMTFTFEQLPNVAPGASGGLFIAGTNAATTVTTSFTTTFTGNLTGSVGSVTGAVGSVTGNVGGNVVGSVGSVTGAVGSVTGNVGGSVASVTAAVSITGDLSATMKTSVTTAATAATPVAASVTGAVGSVTGNVGGNVVGSVASVTAGVALTSAERNSTADAMLDRDMSIGTDSGSTTVRTPRQAFRMLRNKVDTTTLTVYKEDDSTASWTFALTTDAAALPITIINPAGGS